MNGSVDTDGSEIVCSYQQYYWRCGALLPEDHECRSNRSAINGIDYQEIAYSGWQTLELFQPNTVMLNFTFDVTGVVKDTAANYQRVLKSTKKSGD